MGVHRWDGRLFPGAAEFGAAGGFFGGDAEVAADPGVNVLQGAGKRAEFVFLGFLRVGFGFGGGGSPAVGKLGFFDLDGTLVEVDAAVVLNDAPVGLEDALIGLGEAALGDGQGLLVVKDAQEGGEFGRGGFGFASEVEGAFLDEGDAGLIVRNGLAVEEGEEIADVIGVFGVVEEFIGELAVLQVAAEGSVAHFNGVALEELLADLLVGEVVQPTVDLGELVGGEGLELFGEGVGLHDS